MAIPNPNPNIADELRTDNKTLSSNKIYDIIGSQHIKCDVLVNSDASTSHSTINLTDGKKFSDYDLIVFGCVSGGIVRNSIVRPVSSFADTTTGLEIDFSTADTTRWACTKYVSDTSTEIWAFQANTTCLIYGITI